ncbi:sensor histidine kinase [Hoeflea sp. WL0058]|uniref:histidine kinase n=1 Tax=Flavimaribacter sediminis TaxID=2865987 RepID=A0AAE2ZRA7_9HYPH|nr:sensor histidine kinase [Flavimaribacter sediminis]MBW8639360.1 sensor histidine kinase [Flavimaribacter sediminis]
MRFVFFALIVLVTTGSSRAETARIDLSFQVEQSGESVAIEDVCCEEPGYFNGPQVSNTTAGIGGAPLWIKLPVLRPGAVLSITKMVDEAVLYEQRPDDRGWNISVSGDSVKRSGNAIPVPQVAFILSEDVEPVAQRYLRVSQPNLVAFGLQAWDPQAFQQTYEQQWLVTILLLGFVAAIALYNLAVSAFSRELVFALNAMTITSLVFIDLYLTGLGAYYIWTVILSNQILNIALATTIVVGALFISSFLAFDHVKPTSTKVLYALAALAIFVAVSGVVLPYYLPQSLLLILVLAMPVAATVITVVELLKGNKNARILIFPLAMVMVPGGTLVLLRSLTTLQLGIFQAHVLEITLAVEALAFSLALAARIRYHRSIAERARMQLAEIELENARGFVSIQEKERARIALELHDSVGHDMVMMKALIDAAESGRASQEDIRAASGLAKRTLARVRELSHDLHPDTVSQLGWSRSIKSLFANLQRSFGIQVNIKDDAGEPRIDRASQLHLYRVLQELGSNISKHSGASNVSLQLTQSDVSFDIRVDDDGAGLPNPDDVDFGLGFTSIDQRIKTLGGTWNTAKNEPNGTIVRISVPVGKERASVRDRLR